MGYAACRGGEAHAQRCCPGLLFRGCSVHIASQFLAMAPSLSPAVLPAAPTALTPSTDQKLILPEHLLLLVFSQST